ncbi:MAG TPA: helix-turn-helix transcriptional regulator, partial [Gemmatimonadales bacterium]
MWMLTTRISNSAETTMPSVTHAIPYTEIACSHCQGAGSTRRVWGLGMREIRERAGIGLTEMAHRLGISHAFLSDMELGRRRMSEQWARRVLEAC